LKAVIVVCGQCARTPGQFEEEMMVTQKEYAIKTQASFHIRGENDLSLVMPPLL
jgi:hypothetical protein